MNGKHLAHRGARMQRALNELKELVRQRYPDAVFKVCRSPDEPHALDLLAFVDIEDTEEVLDVVIDRLIDMQVEERLPVHVVPLRPLKSA